MILAFKRFKTSDSKIKTYNCKHNKNNMMIINKNNIKYSSSKVHRSWCHSNIDQHGKIFKQHIKWGFDGGQSHQSSRIQFNLLTLSHETCTNLSTSHLHISIHTRVVQNWNRCIDQGFKRCHHIVYLPIMMTKPSWNK